MSVILGINAFHADSAACLVVDGKLVAAVAEERLGDRVKHSPEFPLMAINRILSDNALRIRDLSHVAVARDPNANRTAKALYVAKNPMTGVKAAVEHYKRRSHSTDVIGDLAILCGEDPAQAKYQVIEVEHHLAHIASAYYTSGFEELTAGFSYDASGDFASLMAAKCEGTNIEILDRVCLPDSLGFFYTALCQLIGFDEFGEEYKVMGLAPYGTERFRESMLHLISTLPEGWFKLQSGYFGMHQGGESGAQDERGHVIMGRFYTDKLIADFGRSRNKSEPITQREQDIARSLQVRFEEVALHCFRKLHRLVPSSRLALAGGCALNGVMNARIYRDTEFQDCYLQCASSDDGTCIGAAYWCYHNIVGGTERFHMKHAFWGAGYSESAIRTAVKESGFSFEEYSQDTMLDVVSQHLADGKVLGWYQGRSEWGPRALGNRSILGNPAVPDMKDRINAKVKRRESFRPFAPSVLEEYVSEVFEQNITSPFMMHVVKIHSNWRARIPAVTHVDGTGRLQSVNQEENKLYYQLIESFRKKTGVPLLLNTSFNENEPIVDTPQQAIDCFHRTDLDLLVLGNLVIHKD